MRSNFRAGSAFVALAVAIGLQSPLAAQPAAADASDQAQDPPERNADGSEPEIIVTAQLRAEPLSEVPLSVQAFRGEDLEETGYRDLRDIISLVPGASEGRGNAAGIRSYQIRGVSSFYGDSTIGYYLDEAAYVIPNRNYAPVARSFDMARVEVLRGPQGTLYGLGSMGGTICFITNEPDLQQFRARGDFGISATGEDGDTNSYGDLAVSIPIVRDRLAVRGVASFEHRGGYAASPSFPTDLNDTDTQNYRVRVVARPVDALTLRLGYYRNVTTDDWGQNLRTTDPAAFPASRVPGRNRQVYDMFTGSLSLDLGSVLLESSTGYIDRVDRAVGPIVFIGGPPGLPPVLNVLGESESFVQEVRAVSQGDGPLRWVVGAIYQDASNLEDIAVTFGPPISAISIFDSESWAVFGEISYGFFNDTLRPLIGLRYFEDERTFFTRNRPPGPVQPPPTERVGNFNSLNPRFNLSWQPNDAINLYFNAARGFRSGTFNNAAAVTVGGAGVAFEVTPDRIWSYEVGGKFNLAGDRLYAEVAVYRLDWTDIQLNYTVAGGVQIIRNAGDVRGTGVEFILNWRPTRGLVLSASANFNETEFRSIVNPAVFAATPSIAVGRQVASVPETTLNLAASYTTPIGRWGADFVASANYSYISEQGDPGDPLARFGDDHNLLRARIGVQGEHVGVHLFGENLLDDRDPIQISGSGRTRYYPRVLGVEVNFDF